MKMGHKLTRRGLLRWSGLAGAGALLAACAPQVVKETVVVQQTVIVEKEKEVEKVVKETVVVEKEKEVEVEKVVTSTPLPPQEVDLDIWAWASDDNDANLSALSNALAPFLEDNPLINVNVVPTPNVNQTLQKLMAAIAGNIAPAIAHVDLFTTASWAARLAFEDLTPMADAEGMDPSAEFFDWAVKEGTYDGRLYALAAIDSHSVFMWNKDHFREAGFDPDKPPQSTEELWEYADALDRKDGSMYSRIAYDPIGGILEWPLGFFWSGCSKDSPADFNPFYDYKANKCTINSGRMPECLEWKVEFVERYGIDELEGFRSSFGWAEQDPLGMGLVSMRIGGTWSHNMLKEYFPELDWGVGPFPIPEDYGGTALGPCMGPEGYAIPRGAKGKGVLEQAWEVTRWVTGPIGNEILIEGSDNLSPRRDLINAPWLTRSEQVKFSVTQLECGWNRPTIPEGALLWSESIAAEDMAVHGMGEPQQLLDDVAAKVDEAMEVWA